MKIRVTTAAYIYIKASNVLGHGHALQVASVERDGDAYIIDLPLLGEAEMPSLVGLDIIHLLHQLQGRIANHGSLMSGMEGWEKTADEYHTIYRHCTATGRLRLKLISWGAPSADEICIEICAGSGKTTAAAILQRGEWYRWYGDAFGMATDGMSDDDAMDSFLARQNLNRSDRFCSVVEILFDRQQQYDLPGQDIRDYPWWGMGAAIAKCLAEMGQAGGSHE